MNPVQIGLGLCSLPLKKNIFFLFLLQKVQTEHTLLLLQYKTCLLLPPLPLAYSFIDLC